MSNAQSNAYGPLPFDMLCLLLVHDEVEFGCASHVRIPFHPSPDDQMCLGVMAASFELAGFDEHMEA